MNGRIQVSDQDGVRLIRLDRAVRRNALDLPMTQALHAALQGAQTDAGVRAVVLAGAGQVFCAGGDLREAAEQGQDVVDRRLELTLVVLHLLRRSRPPVVAAVQGAALGGGAGLALACDLIVAAEEARFGYPGASETPVGLLVMTMLRASLGARRAFAMLSLGQIMDGAAMVAAGLAHRAVPADAVLPAAEAIAAAWAAVPPATMQGYIARLRCTDGVT